MAIYFKDIEITNIDNLVPQSGLDITDIWFGSTNVYTVWATYEGTIPATINANGDSMKQYQVWGNTGGVVVSTENLLEITQDMYNPENWDLADPYEGVVYFMYYRLPQNVIEHLQNIGTIAGTVYLKPNGSYDGEVLAITNLKGGEGTRPITDDYRLLTKNGRTLNFSKDVSTWSDIYLGLGFSGGIPQDKRILIDELFQNYNIMLNAGSTALPYQPYGYKLDMVSGTANVFNADVESGSISRIDGSYITANTRLRTNFMSSLLAAGTYTLKFDGVDNVTMRAYDAEKNYNRGASIADWYQSPFTFTITENLYIRFVFSKSDDSILYVDDISNIMLNAGSTALPYQPYSNTVTPIYIGSDPLNKDEYVDYQAGKIYRMIDSTLTPTDPPVPLPALPTVEGETIVDYAGAKTETTKNILPSAQAQTLTVNGNTCTCDGQGRYHVDMNNNTDTNFVFSIPDFTIPVSVGQGGNGTWSMFNTASQSMQVKLYYNDTEIDYWSIIATNRASDSYASMGGKTINKIIINAWNASVDGDFAFMFTDDGVLPAEFVPHEIAKPTPEKVVLKYRKENF